MIRVRLFLERLDVGAAASWPTFWVVYALNVSLTFFSSFGVAAAWWERMIAITVGQFAMFSVLGLATVINRHRAPSVSRGVLALAWFAIAGATRGVAVGVVLSAWGDSSLATEWARLASGILLGLAILTPMAVLVSAARDFARARDELLERAEQLNESALRITEDMEERDRLVVDRIRMHIAEALDEDGKASADRLDRVMREVIRPLSHDLAASVPSWQPPPSLRRRSRIQWRHVLNRAATGAPLMPVTTTGLVGLLSVASVVFVAGPMRAVVYYIAGAVLMLSSLYAANAVLVRQLPGKSFSTRATMVLGAIVIAGAVVGAGAVGVVMVTGGLDGRLELIQVFLVLLSVVFIFALTATIARAATLEQGATLVGLREADLQLKKRVTRMRQVQWSQQRALARALHGPVQALVGSAITRLRAADDGGVGILSRDLERDLLDVLSPSGRADDRVEWARGIERVRATWAGVVDVDARVASDAAAVLGSDVVVCDLVVEIVSEAVANAARHGDAGRVVVAIECRGDDLVIDAMDDGIKGLGDGSGMGSRLLSECCVWWERREEPSGVRLAARLPLGSA